MAHLPTLASRPTALDLAERAYRRPSSTIWLHRVRVGTCRFEEALQFYVGTLGLALRTVELDPGRSPYLRAVLVDAEARDVLELVEADGGAGGVAGAALHGLTFGLPRRAWQLLRTRLDTQGYPYTLSPTVITLHDADGLRLRVEPLDEGR
jgi:catechol 2,3-dioxygenase-like lactoylglutathione lyase family enzyme